MAIKKIMMTIKKKKMMKKSSGNKISGGGNQNVKLKGVSKRRLQQKYVVVTFITLRRYPN